MFVVVNTWSLSLSFSPFLSLSFKNVFASLSLSHTHTNNNVFFFLSLSPSLLLTQTNSLSLFHVHSQTISQHFFHSSTYSHWVISLSLSSSSHNHSLSHTVHYTNSQINILSNCLPFSEHWSLSPRNVISFFCLWILLGVSQCQQ